MLIAWALLLVACAATYPILNSRLDSPDFVVDRSESVQLDELLAQHFPQLGTEQTLIVFHSATETADDANYRNTVGDAVAAAQQVDGVAGAISPYFGDPTAQISADRRTAFALVALSGDTPERAAVAEELGKRIGDVDAHGIDVALTGFSPMQNDMIGVQTHDMERAEALGIPVAFLLLVLTLAAVMAALVPLAVAIAGLLAAFGVLFALTSVMPLDAMAVSMASMIGIGVGIDYAMFIVSRFREELARTGATDRAGVAEAVGIALATAGRTILASGLVVMVSLCSLVVVRAPIFRGIAIGVATAVLCTLVVAMTLLPATLAKLGPAINRGALPPRYRPAELRDNTEPRGGGWARWAHVVMARPLLFGGAAIALLAVLALPLSGIRYGLDLGFSALSDTSSGQGWQRVTDNFEPGLLSPIEVLATGAGDTPLDAAGKAQVDGFLDDARRADGIAGIQPMSANGRTFAMVIPTVQIDSTDATAIVEQLRERASAMAANGGPQILIGGSTAEFVDISDEITARVPLVVALVLGTSFVFLVFAFRSLVLPVKAVLMNLLATGAALGVTVMVFQWGVGANVLNFQSTGFLQVYLPTIVFAVLFGLSMDYEVFLIHRMKESWEATGDNDDAVATGIQHTARPITAAAAIMIVIFGSFVTADVLELKQIGFALAIAILIDAVVVRLILVPALMRLFGHWNWWLPKVGTG